MLFYETYDYRLLKMNAVQLKLDGSPAILIKSLAKFGLQF